MPMTSRRRVTRWRSRPEPRANDVNGTPNQAVEWDASERADVLAVEEPLEIRLGDAPYSVTMRTPGHDLDLALGFLLSEGVITGASDVVAAMHCPDAERDANGLPTHNVVEIQLADPTRAGGVTATQPRAPRQVNSACGVCGTTSIEEISRRISHSLLEDDTRFAPALIADLPRRLRERQSTFERTGGVHAAGLFDTAGTLLCLREDVGRHNAVDKVIGWALAQDRLPLRGTVLQVSGRASFELVQKASSAGIPVLAAVSAPSSLAVELALQMGLTLIGFSRESTFNAYTRGYRVATGVTARADVDP